MHIEDRKLEGLPKYIAFYREIRVHSVVYVADNVLTPSGILQSCFYFMHFILLFHLIKSICCLWLNIHQNYNLVIQYIYKQRKDLQNLETDKKTFQVKNIFSQIYAYITNCLVLILVPYTFSKLVTTLCFISIIPITWVPQWTVLNFTQNLLDLLILDIHKFCFL